MTSCIPTADAPEPLCAVAIHQAVSRGETRAVAVLEQALARIATVDGAVHAWTEVDRDAALAAACAIDAGERRSGLLAGVPLAVKDIFRAAGTRTTFGSPIFRDAPPDAEDADCVAAARAAQAVVLGKTVSTEFAYFTPGPTANPWDTGHTPGGSSSGSAAAVASGMVPLAIGSQTAGSLIRPASYCGVFGLKATYGRYSLRGTRDFSRSLDTLGWMARSADDLELMRCALAGEAYAPLPVPQAGGLRLGYWDTFEAEALDAGGRAAFETAVARCGAAGIHLEAVALPGTLRGLAEAQKTVMAYEACRALAPEYENHRDLMGPALVQLVETGLGIGDAAYAAAQALAEQGRAAAADLLRHVDALLVPAAPGEAPAGLAATGDPVFSRVWTLLGQPCVSVPGLFGPNGLPIGTQLVGRWQQDRALLAAAARLRQALAA
ncbi:amidase [Verticiella sediminum]|uniref:Amidase n=1 Tax=Verticiella sediminum TaxID=1247510 RepID=A0A556AIH5_9BURK|nr:amidase [Verticiella sediminum]TSH92714.1 amidase [Verticiella sediminum]